MRRIATRLIVILMLALFLASLAGSSASFASPHPWKPVDVTNGGTIVISGSGAHLVTSSSSGRSLVISIDQQRLWAYQDGRVVRTFLVSTGRPGFRTPRGRFHIRAKGLNWLSHKWNVWMPYAMNFFSNYNLHSLPYAVPGHLIGASELGTPRSHGCVRIGPDNAKWLYWWTPLGTPLWIR